ncbi:MAG: hypothetical protein M1822_004681 [Bathelium mastoideum]|nr:MAG: hypothetical protein M1822_004681 [Bathelium mastoideum]
MSDGPWIIKEYVIPAAHRRSLPRGLKDEESGQLRLHVKQWTPKANGSPQSGDATIVFAHGVGSSKESYEVFFEHLVQHHPRIRSIFAMDVAHHGQSYMLNKAVIGDEPGWHDAARDLIHMINTFQTDMVPPVIGIAQSWGGAYMLMAADMHPRLFDGVIVVEPSLAMQFKERRGQRTVWMMQRQDWWPSREAAREALLRLGYYRRFDPRVFERVMKYDLRDVTPDDPPFDRQETDASSVVGLGVTLTTPKAQEVYTMVLDHTELPGHSSRRTAKATDTPRTLARFDRPELLSGDIFLPNVYPPINYVWGEFSDIANRPPGGPIFRKHLLEVTGASHAGGGGAANGQVTESWVKDCTHPIPLEKPEEFAKTIVPWLTQRRTEWLENQVRIKKQEFHTAKISPRWLSNAHKL